MLNLGNIERPKTMALTDEEINKINGLFREIDILKAENTLLKDNLNDRFDKVEELLTDLASKGSHEDAKMSSVK